MFKLTFFLKKSFEKKLSSEEKNSNRSEEIQVDTTTPIDEASAESKTGEEVLASPAAAAEETVAEDISVTKKKRFNFKLTDLNPLKKRKKILNNTEDKNVDVTVTNEMVKDDDHKSIDEPEPENKPEETLDEAEKSEAENVLHELPTASSGDKKEETLSKKLSAKEKLKQKLDKKKSSEREPARLLRHLSTQSSRLEDRLKEEDQDAQTAFDRHDVTMKLRREKQKDEITAEDAYDFFTGTFDESSPETAETRRKSEPQGESGEAGGDGGDGGVGDGGDGGGGGEGEDKRKLLSQHYIGSEYEWEVTEWAGPDLVPCTVRLERESSLYFTPSSLPPSLQQILQQPGLTVSREEEGLHTGKFPALHTGNINKMGNRILEERKHNPDQPADWFSSSGTLTRLNNPLLKHAMRPGAGEEEEEPLSRFVAAVPSEAEHNLISSMALQGGGRPCQLELDIASLVFSHHHLFSLEHYMTRSLYFSSVSSFITFHFLTGD